MTGHNRNHTALVALAGLLLAACNAVVPPATQTATPLPIQQVVSTRLLAQLFGQVVLAGDCLRVLNSHAPGESLLLVFPADFTAEVSGGAVLLSDLREHKQVTWHIGDTVEAFGGNIPQLDASLRPVPADCAGPYFVLNGWVTDATPTPGITTATFTVSKPTSIPAASLIASDTPASTTTSSPPTPMPTFPVVTATRLPSSTPSLSPKSCSSPVPLADAHFASSLSGTLLYTDKGKLVAVDGASQSEHIVSDLTSADTWPLIGLSPDGQSLAYLLATPETGAQRTLRRISSAGVISSQTITPPAIAFQPGHAFDWYPLSWIDDTLLLTGVYTRAISRDDVIPDQLSILDLTTGTWQPTLLDSLPQRSARSTVAISPDLTRALYIAQRNKIFDIVLWSYQKNSALWSQETTENAPIVESNNSLTVAWSPDSEAVAFTINTPNEIASELVVLGRNGDSLATVLGRSDQITSGALSWSPNSKFLSADVGGVMDLSVWPPENIVVYSRSDNRIVFVCPVNSPTDALASEAIQWSPDSSLVVFGNGETFLSKNNGVLASEFSTGETVLLRQGLGVRFIGWSPVRDWGTSR